MIRRQSHSPVPGQRCQQKNSFHPGKAFANAPARSTAKWKIGKLRPSLAGLRGPALRIKSKWINEIARIAVHYVLAH